MTVFGVTVNCDSLLSIALPRIRAVFSGSFCRHVRLKQHPNYTVTRNNWLHDACGVRREKPPSTANVKELRLKTAAVHVLASYSGAQPVNKGDDVTPRHGDALVLLSHTGRLRERVAKITDLAKGRGKVCFFLMN